MENIKLVSKVFINEEDYKMNEKQKLQERLCMYSTIIFELMNTNGDKYVRCCEYYNVNFDFQLKDGRIVCIDLTNNVIIPKVADYIMQPDQLKNLKGLRGNLILFDKTPSFMTTKEIDAYYATRHENSLVICDDKRRKEYGNVVVYTDDKECIPIDDYKSEGRKKVNVYVAQRLENQNWDALKFFEELILKYEIMPVHISDEQKNILSLLMELYKYKDRYFKIDEYFFVRFNLDNIWEDLMVKSKRGDLVRKLVELLCEDQVEEKMITKEELLNCEKIRADIEPYEEKILTDPNRGHWDLWSDEKNGNHYIEVEENYIARNPIVDVKEEGVIAIDFGTKSTVVVYQGDIEHSLPMGIGDGNLSKGPSVKRYENPTVMQFVNIENFLTSYHAKKGRPNTKWDDLTISHTALDKFDNCKSEEYYSYLYQLKQWAGQRGKQLKIKSVNNEMKTLAPFMELSDDDLNPIELYAYYIGLYINNMRHGIFLDYYLSFPVTYEKIIREKIIANFKKGLQKSLPEEIQNNKETMSKFSVNGSISEPAAYAACALQEYGIEPDEGEKIYYGIFDFGGGTTDFDFGLWEKSEKKRYDYKIENYGAGGDKFLGGENLLQMLAFDIFKNNQDIMLNGGYTFTLAPKSTEFAGSDALLSNSQEAEKNMHNLMEHLRPYWEQSDEEIEKRRTQILNIIHDKETKAEHDSEYCKKYGESLDKLKNAINNNELPIEFEYECILSKFQDLDEDFQAQIENDNNVLLNLVLYDKTGSAHPGVELKTTRRHIIDFIHKKIAEGIDNFFNALMLSYQNDCTLESEKVNIFLAGNSCKSLLVKRLFKEKIQERVQKLKEESKEHIKDDLFVVYPPLGTPEAHEIMQKNNIAYEDNDFEKPTGKTGVAFGLIKLRKGGNVEYVSGDNQLSEIPFQYFLGYYSKKKFVLFKDENKSTQYKGKPDYNTWYNFIEADADTFYLYYTTLPECVSGDLIVDGNPAVRRLKCQITAVNEDANVYIKAINPHAIQYVVSTSPDVEQDRLCEIVTKELD